MVLVAFPLVGDTAASPQVAQAASTDAITAVLHLGWELEAINQGVQWKT